MTTPLLLPEPYSTALVAAEAFIRSEIEVRAMVVSGTVVRGTGQANSDLDIVVVHDAPWRQRLQGFFNGVPAEMFVNPPFQIRRQMENDARAARPVMAHMLATGNLLHDDPAGMGAALQEEAHANLAAGPVVDPEWLELRRYGIAGMFEDAIDLATIDPERAQAFAVQAVIEAIEWWFPAHGHWLPRAKTLLSEFEEYVADWSVQARRALRAPNAATAITEATPLIQHLLGGTGFFEWSGGRQYLSPQG